MKFRKKTLALILVLCFVISVTGCNVKSGAGVKEVSLYFTEGYSKNNADDYESTVSDWKNEKKEQSEFYGSQNTFSNNKDDELTPKPGSSSVFESVANHKHKIEENEVISKALSDMTESYLISSASTFKYTYEGSNYAYGITSTGYEYIAYRDPDGNMYDILAGGGKLNIKTSEGNSAISVNTIKDFEEIEVEGCPALKVKYDANGIAAEKSTIVAIYIFRDYGITFEVDMDVVSQKELSSGSLDCAYVNDCIASETEMTQRWIYPEDGDYPYPESDRLAFKRQFADNLWLYTFLSPECTSVHYNYSYKSGGASLPLTFESTSKLSYTYKYDMLFINTDIDGENREYLGYFKSYDSDFAAGVAPVTDGDGSTIFVGDEVQLNFNITNLKDQRMKYSVRYDVRDYYGNVVESGIFLDNNIAPLKEANRLITVNPKKYGMYYLNLRVDTENSTYGECYPFAILEEYEYKYNTTNPFGIAAMTKGGDDNLQMISARIAAKVGFGNARIARDSIEVQEMMSLGIKSFNGAINPVNDKADNVESYVEKVLSRTDAMVGLIDSIEVGNEMSLEASRAKGRPLEKLYPLFYNYTYQPTLKAIKEKYPNLKYIPCPFSACEQNWINMFSEGYVDSDGDGVADFDSEGKLIRNPENASWADVEIVATHIYGNPWMPDAYASHYLDNEMWVIESGMIRMKEMYDSHRSLRGGKDDPDFYLTEVGYPSSPVSDTTVCLRTQADYTARIGVICAAYSVDRIQYYQMYDRISSGVGYRSSHNEWNFGLCYEQDYYGMVKPKPAIIAFAAMTRQLESVNKNGAVISEKYDEGCGNGGVRAFEFETALHGKVIAAYSNQQVLANGRKYKDEWKTGDRTPCYPWENKLWTETDETVFDATGETVTVVDTMGNKTVYEVSDGKVTIPLTGEVVYIFGVE